MGAIRKFSFYRHGHRFTQYFPEGLFLAQYQVLRNNGHTPSEAFNETVEEATQSLYPLIGQKGYD